MASPSIAATTSPSPPIMAMASPSPPTMTSPPTVVIREVWRTNLDQEFKLINQCLGRFPFASFDTEYPGVVFNTDIPGHVFSSLSASELYVIMKRNVDETKLVQLGLTLFDAHGNLPQFGMESYVWQFNFRDFDSDRDLHNPESIALLRGQGIDFAKNKSKGIDSHSFAIFFNFYGLANDLTRAGNLTWITFQGLYDYGYMIKILTGKRLPDRYEEYLMLVQRYFGFAVYDLKPMAQTLGLYGGLEKIVQKLNLVRAAGRSHQAGSDSMMMMQVFLKLSSITSPHMFISDPVHGWWFARS